jgi:DNA-binding transcriptional MerR regulator
MRRHNRDADSEALQFGSGEVCQLAGVTLRQLQWWDERKIISPRQQGHRRLYIVSDVIGMMVIGELRRKGLSLQKVRRLVSRVRREVERRVDELLSGTSELYFLSDGTSSYFEDQPARIIERLKNSTKPLAVVSISDMGRRLAEFQQPGSCREAHVRGKRQLKLF